MLSRRKPIDPLSATLMVTLCLTWGLQQVALKAAAPDVTPLLQLALRSGIAALLVALYMALRKQTIDLKNRHWRPGIAVGLLFASEFLLLGEGLRHSTASHMVVMLYTAPIFAAIGLHLAIKAERLHFAQWLGVLLAFAGILTAFLGHNPPAINAPPANTLLGDSLGLLAAISWAATTVLVRTTSLAHAPPAETLLYQLIIAFVLLLSAAIAMGQLHFNPTPIALWTLAFQSLIVSFASFLTWFWLLRHYLASRLGALSFMTPLFGVLLGVLLLREPLDHSFLTGAALVLAGIVLVSGYPWLRLAATRLLRLLSPSSATPP
jgi:drug/metabolite transporter (DMT)-like permease